MKLNVLRCGLASAGLALGLGLGPGAQGAAPPAPPAPPPVPVRTVARPPGAAPVAAPAAAAPAPVATGIPRNAPKIQFNSLAHDFGRLESGTVTKHEFVFTNTGTAVLEITDVRPGCGCTTAGTWDKRVEPGQTGKIPLQFNTTGFGGAVTKGATVTCNDPTQPNVYLQLKGDIWRPIEVTPLSLFFSVSAESPANEVRVVRIVNHRETPLVLSDLSCTNTAFKADLRTVQEGKEYEVRVSVQPPLVGNYVQTAVTVKTSATNTPLLTIPVYANIQPAVVVSPSQILLPAGPLATPRQNTVSIRGSSTNALVVSEPSINLEGATVTLKEQQAGRLFSLLVSLPAGLNLDANQRVEVTVKSNHPKYPVIRVPVYQQRRTAPVAASVPTPTPQPPPLLARPPEEPASRPAPTR